MIGYTVRFVKGVYYYVKGVYTRFMEDDMLLYGSALAFNFILCLIPLLLLLTSLIGIFLSSSEMTLERINDLLNAGFPDQPYANKIKSSIQDVVFDIIENRTSFGILSVVVLTWTATFLFSAIRSALNRIYRMKPTKLFLLMVLENVAAVIAVGALFLVSNFVFWLSSLIAASVESMPELRMLQFGALIQAFPTVFTSLLVFVMFYIMYQFMPDKRIMPKAAVISSLTSTTMWVVAGKAFQFYVTNFSNMSKVYGTYAFLLVFLVWIEYSSIVFITGAVVGQLFIERYPGRDHKKLK